MFMPFNIVAETDTFSIKYDSSSVITPLKIDQEHINKYKNDSDFDYTEYKYENSTWKKIKRWFYNLFLRLFKWIFGQKKAAGLLDKFFSVIPYFAIGVLAYLLIRFLIRVNFKEYFAQNTDEAEVKYGEDEEIIRNKDISTLLKNAEDNGNYRLALRYYFLKLLKELEKNKIIKWEPQKTNFEYLKEIRKRDYKDRFKKFNFWYDYIWYGKYPLDKQEFDLISKDFNSFLESVER